MEVILFVSIIMLLEIPITSREHGGALVLEVLFLTDIKFRNMFWGSIVFEFIGVLVRFLIQYLVYPFTKKELKSFVVLWNGPDKEDPVNFISYGFSNVLIGFSALMIFVALTIYVF